MTAARYVIHRVNLAIETSDEPTARRMQDEAARIFRNWILPNLEELLARLVPKDRVFRLDRLDLDLDVLHPVAFEQEFSEAVLAHLAAQVEKVVAAASDTADQDSTALAMVLTEEERAVAAFCHFLAMGQLPWWSEREPAMLEEGEFATVLERMLQADTDATARLIALFALQPAALERLLVQFSPSFILRLVRLLLPSVDLPPDLEFTRLADVFLHRLSASAVTNSDEALGSVPEQRYQLLQNLFSWLHGARSLPKQVLLVQLKEYLEHLVHHRRASVPNDSGSTLEAKELPLQISHRQAPVDPKKQEQQPDKDGVHVDHAGLILLHPFLEYFFREFDLLDNKEFRDGNARCLAMHLLHFLATGRESPPEYLLTFEKFLCGAELLAPIPRFVELTRAMKEESETLLRAAIGHWQALKNTSPDGLREGFLQRLGKLSSGSFENRLIVESKSHDVLLGYLPWGYGIIKLPWLQLPLLVDWGG